MESKIANNFNKLLESLSDTHRRINSKKVSWLIYYNIFRIRESQWKYKVDFKRKIDYSLSNIFQDIVAHYLKKTLSSNFEVIIEEKIGKVRPDILIRKNGKNWAAIEIKTNIGWNRWLVNEENHKIRLKQLSKQLNISFSRVFYIFETIENVNKTFVERFNKNHFKGDILPLFRFRPRPRSFTKKHKRFSDKEIRKLFIENKITDFAEIKRKIVGNRKS